MIRYDLTVYIGESMREKRPVIKSHDTGVTLSLRLVVIRKVSEWRDEPKDYAIPSGATAFLQIRKPDKTYTVTDVSIENGRVICPLPAQACTAPGVCYAEVRLFNADGKRLTTATFEFEVVKECICDCDKESETYVDVLGQQVKTAVESAANAKEFASAAKADADRSAHLAEEVAANAAKTAQEATGAEQAKEAAQTAQRLAEEAKHAAETAQKAAETAQSAANRSATDADAAKQAAEAALKATQDAAAEAAQSLAALRALYEQMQEWAAGVVQAVSNEGARQVQAVRDEGNTQTANAKSQADAAKLSADNAAQSATEAGNAKTGAENAKDAAVTAQGKAEDAQQGAETARDRAETAAIKQPYPNAETGTWWTWDADKAAYVDSGEPHEGAALYATFDVDPTTGKLSVYTPARYHGPEFSLNEATGKLEVTING